MSEKKLYLFAYSMQAMTVDGAVITALHTAGCMSRLDEKTATEDAMETALKTYPKNKGYIAHTVSVFQVPEHIIDATRNT